MLAVKVELVLSNYPLSFAICGNELCLYNWDEDREIFALPISDAQITAIRETAKRAKEQTECACV